MRMEKSREKATGCGMGRLLVTWKRLWWICGAEIIRIEVIVLSRLPFLNLFWIKHWAKAVTWGWEGTWETVGHGRWYDGRGETGGLSVWKAERTESQEEERELVECSVGGLHLGGEGGWLPPGLKFDFQSIHPSEPQRVVEGGDIHGGKGESPLSGCSRVWKAEG